MRQEPVLETNLYYRMFNTVRANMADRSAIRKNREMSAIRLGYTKTPHHTHSIITHREGYTDYWFTMIPVYNNWYSRFWYHNWFKNDLYWYLIQLNDLEAAD